MTPETAPVRGRQTDEAAPIAAIERRLFALGLLRVLAGKRAGWPSSILSPAITRVMPISPTLETS
jgi:hypothetical protein